MTIGVALSVVLLDGDFSPLMLRKSAIEMTH